MKVFDAPTYTCRLYVAGPIEVAKQLLRAECHREGLCVTIEPTLYVYTGGEEAGYVVGLVNYPRFPTMPDALFKRAQAILEMLIEQTHQTSGLLVAPDNTRWISHRKDTE